MTQWSAVIGLCRFWTNSKKRKRKSESESEIESVNNGYAERVRSIFTLHFHFASP